MMKVLCLLAALTGGTMGYINPRPPFTEKARFARWLIHESNWTVLASKSVAYGGSPYPNMLASSDGESWDQCTPNVYLYIATPDTIIKDKEASNDFTLGFFENGENDKFCMPSQTFDPEDPNCAKVHLIGKLDVICTESACPAAKKELFWRHPAMANWPTGHSWQTMRFNISKIDVLDFYGGISTVTVDDFTKADCK